jgi:hypothetical protein
MMQKWLALFALCSSPLAAVAQDGTPAESAEAPPPSAAADEAPLPVSQGGDVVEESVMAEAPTSSGAVLTMSPEELAALGLDASEPSLDTALKVSGFADVGFGFMIGPQNDSNRAIGAVPPHSTFYVGNFNVYLTKQLTEQTRMMGEVRLTYLPNGSSAFGIENPVDTTTYDYADFGRTTRWGGIILQRVYVEYTPHPWFNIRAGQFLTPYGVWNVDHGSPVVIPVRRPWSIGVGWIPERQTGIEINGRSTVARDHVLGYHLTISNGTGPVTEYRDLDENKAVGGRAYWEFRALGRLRLGGSAYYGRDTNARIPFMYTATGEARSGEVIVTQSDTLAWAADLTWSLGGLHLQSEWITHQRAYTDRGRTAVASPAGTRVVPRDFFSWGGYALVGYRFRWLGLMPFFMSERVKGELMLLPVTLYTLQGGLNMRPTESLVLKATYEYVRFSHDAFDPVKTVMTQVAWAF